MNFEHDGAHFKPDVSVILPMYNGEKFIESALSSVKYQNFHGSIELVVIDDGSSDASLDHAHALKQLYDSQRFHISLYDQKNQGIAQTKYAASQLAQADLVLMLDQDDYLLPGAVQAVVKGFESNPDVAIIYTDHDVIAPSGELIRSANKRQYDIFDFLTGFPLGHLKGFRKNVLVEHYPVALTYNVAEDFALCSSIVFSGHSFVHESSTQYLYVVADHNVTQSKQGLTRQYVEAKDIIAQNFSRLGMVTPMIGDLHWRSSEPNSFTHYLTRDFVKDYYLSQKNSIALFDSQRNLVPLILSYID